MAPDHHTDVPPPRPDPRLIAATRQEVQAFIALWWPQPDSPAPQWLATPEGQQYLAATAQGEVETALALLDAAFARALSRQANAICGVPLDGPDLFAGGPSAWRPQADQADPRP